jgi:signal transduction histidine kinase/DNA-binding response OmpR family regulator
MGPPQHRRATELAQALETADTPAQAARFLVEWLVTRRTAAAVFLLDGQHLLSAGDLTLIPHPDTFRACADACDWPTHTVPQPAADGTYVPIHYEDSAYGILWTSAPPPDTLPFAVALLAARLHLLHGSGGRDHAQTLEELSLSLHMLPSEDGWRLLGEQMRLLFTASAFCVGLLDASRAQLHFPLAYEDDLPYERAPMPLTGLAGLVLRHGTSLLFTNLPAETQRLAALGLDESPAVLGGAVVSWLGVPLRSRNRDILGLICLQSALVNAFDEHDLLTLMSVGAQLMLAVESAQVWEAERERRTIASVLTDVNRVVSATLNYDEVLDLILEQLHRVIDYDRASILLPSADRTDGSHLVVCALQGPDPQRRGMEIVVAPDSPLMQVYRSHQPLLLGQLAESPLWPDEPHPAHGLSWMAAPLLAQEQVVGILTVEKQMPAAYTERDVSTVFALAGPAAVAVENASLHGQAQAGLVALQERSRRQTSLGHINTIVTSTLELDTILISAAQLVTELFQIDHCAIALLDESRGEVRIRAEYPNQGNLDTYVALEAEFSALVRYNTVITVADPRSEDMDDVLRRLIVQTHVRSALLVPLSVRDRNIGLMVMSTVNRRHDFDEDERETFMTVAGQVALAVHNAELYQQAVAASRLKSEFLATMSHELRTPLNAILGYSDLLLEQSYGELNERQMDRLQRLNSSGRRLLALINDVLDLSKIEAGQMDLRLAPVRLSELLLAAISEVRPRAEVKGLPINLAVDPDERLVSGDPNRLRQVIVNLLDNAVKFTHSGEVTLMITRYVQGNAAPTSAVLPPSYVVVPDGEWVALSVRDTGIGIRPEHQRMVFDAFQQVDGSMTRQYEGTGLGLAITHQLVTLHHGFLWVDSEPGRGSTFTALLPALPVVRSDETLLASDTRTPVLILEGDTLALDHLRAGLDEVDYVVRAAPNPVMLASLARQAAKPVIVVTPALFDSGGLALLHSLRQDAATRMAPALLMLPGAVSDAFFLLGIVQYIRKPLDREQVLATVTLVLRAATQEPILIVDDDLRDQKTIGDWLGLAGYQTAFATSAASALQWLAQWPASLILVNVLLPDCEAFTLMQRLNTDNFTANIPLILLHPQRLDTAERALLRAGAERLLQQPDLQSLTAVEVVQAALQQRRLRERQQHG